MLTWKVRKVNMRNIRKLVDNMAKLNVSLKAHFLDVRVKKTKAGNIYAIVDNKYLIGFFCRTDRFKVWDKKCPFRTQLLKTNSIMEIVKFIEKAIKYEQKKNLSTTI